MIYLIFTDLMVFIVIFLIDKHLLFHPIEIPNGRYDGKTPTM